MAERARASSRVKRPMATAATTKAAMQSGMLTGGEDHALLATFPPGTALPPGFTAIGRVVEGEPAVLVDGAVREDGGHRHFG